MSFNVCHYPVVFGFSTGFRQICAVRGERCDVVFRPTNPVVRIATTVEFLIVGRLEQVLSVGPAR